MDFRVVSVSTTQSESDGRWLELIAEMVATQLNWFKRPHVELNIFKPNTCIYMVVKKNGCRETSTYIIGESYTNKVTSLT